MVSEESVCSHCGTIYDCPIGASLRGLQDENLCQECYWTVEEEDRVINEEK